MKIKNIFYPIFILLGFFVCSFAQAEIIDNYHVDIKINKDSTVSITENILYNFEDVERHGIFRTLPYSYQNSKGHFNLKYENIQVKDENGKEYTSEVSQDFSNYEIKIGDADVLVKGQKNYIISYTVKKAINYFSDHDELYWNAIGTEWEVPIKNISITVNGENINQSECYFGSYGSQKKCSFSIQKIVVYTTIESLSPNEGITIAIGFPKGTVYEPSDQEKMMEFIQDNWYFPIPFIILFIYFYRWYRYGRDPKGKNIVIAQYSPLSNSSPLEANAIITENVNTQKIGAEIIQLAIKGYLKIEKINEKSNFFGQDDYAIKKLKESDDNLTEFQSKLINSFFASDKKEITTEEIKKLSESLIPGEYIKDLKEFIVTKGPDMIYDKLTKENYFSSNPNSVRITNMIVGGLMIFPLFIIPLIFGFIIPGALGFVFFFIVLILSALMPKKTTKGVEAREYLLGLRKYISVAEIERIKFHNAPEKTPEHFEELLPYAIVFGLEKEWAKKFESLSYQPNWYAGPNGMAFSSAMIASDLSNIGNSFSMSMASSGASGLGGGGGVGGGGGGGGGGSW
jgi:uncharacterized membrane protein YgcG